MCGRDTRAWRYLSRKKKGEQINTHPFNFSKINLPYYGCAIKSANNELVTPVVPVPKFEAAVNAPVPWIAT